MSAVDAGCRGHLNRQMQAHFSTHTGSAPFAIEKQSKQPIALTYGTIYFPLPVGSNSFNGIEQLTRQLIN